MVAVAVVVVVDVVVAVVVDVLVAVAGVGVVGGAVVGGKPMNRRFYIEPMSQSWLWAGSWSLSWPRGDSWSWQEGHIDDVRRWKIKVKVSIEGEA